jgi:pimeloyl-ACP methyl ester carboxylesterase
MYRLLRHLIVGFLAVTTLGPALTPAPRAQAQIGETSTFAILARGARIGSETVTVTRTGSGWLISMFGRQAPPIDLLTTKFEMTYGADWQPQKLVIEGVLRGQVITLGSTFGLTTATIEVMQAAKKGSFVRDVTPRTIVLPNNFFGAYEALAARLASAVIGTRLPIFVAPDGEISAMVDKIAPRRLTTPGGPIDLRQFDLTFANPTGPLPVEVWTDARNRLARVTIPAAALSAVREDIASVMTREEPIRNPGDEDVFIPVSGFNLAATITRPQNTTGLPAAVVLVAGAGPQDRDESTAGIPVFGQLAGSLANSGLFVVRYDKRGVGQSGGRPENATLAEYGEDVVNIVRWLKRRKDVDTNRIVVVGHGEGGAVALVAADREGEIRAVGLVAAPGLTGREVTLEQQQYELEKLKEPEADRKAKIALQLRVLDAAVSGKGWEGVPPDLRRRADTPWFRSWLLFDPGAAIRKVNQPILILQGGLDRQIPPAHAARLESFSIARKKPASHTRKVVIDGINHLLTPARTGEPEEYSTLPVKDVSPDVAAAIAAWIADVVPVRR